MVLWDRQSGLYTRSQHANRISVSYKNDRLALWDTSLANGLESHHAHVDPCDISKYDSGFTLVLNPIDTLPSADYDDSSASNADCVLRLAVHTLVISVESNVPVYWLEFGTG